MFIISTPDNNKEHPQLKFVKEINDGVPSYTSKKEFAQQFEEADAQEIVATLHQNFGKTFSIIHA